MKSIKLAWKNEYPNINLLLILLFCGYVVTWYLEVGERIPFLGSIRFEFIYAILLILLVPFVRTSFKSPLYIYVALYIFIVALRVPISYDTKLSWLTFWNHFLKLSFMGLFIIVFLKNPKSLLYFVVTFLLCFLKMGQEGLIGKISGQMIWENQGIMRLHGSTPLYSHSNSFSGTQIGILPFLNRLFPLSPWFVKIVFLIQFIFIGNIVLYTGSRTGYVGFLAYIVFIIYRSKIKKKAFFYAIIFVLITIPFIPGQYYGRFESIFTLKEKEGDSAETRIQILKDASEIFLRYPLGIGVGAFPSIRHDTFGRDQDTHNLYLQIATNLGVPGLIIFGLLIYKLLKTLRELTKNFTVQIKILEQKFVETENIVSRLKIAEHERQLKFLRAMSNIVFEFVIIRLVLGLFGHDLYEIYWWFSIGLTIALSNMNEIALLRTFEAMEEPNLKEEALVASPVTSKNAAY